jgi:cellulose synthase/poly-beta-1,6-N-acetylglucosamine synthase-like glycosyltransferase/peptidoglycan/xylan/chitin deacetylase (PgdA/CDA1 family)
VLVSLVMLVFAVGLVIEGYTRGVLGENSADEPSQGPRVSAAPATVSGGGPVIQVTGSHVRSYSMPVRTIALTFDDGPDPTWTPSILAILRRYRVPATFFLVGAHVASYPGLVQEELGAGDEVGSHTYTHTNLATAGWREGFELTLTQNALAGAAGIHTRLLRMPYSSEPDALTGADWRAALQAGRDGYLVVLANLDTRDWARPGVAHIVSAAMPSGGRGAIIMFHDGGGNRGQTAAALPAIIKRLQAEGYRFTTVTAGLRLPAGDVPATTRQQFAGTALVLIQQAADHTVALLAVLLVAASVLTVIRLTLLVGFATAHRRRARLRRARRPVRYDPDRLPDVSVVIPAYNEAAGIAATIRSMVRSRYRGRIEIIVVDDGSSDDTAVIAHSLGIPYVHVISQPNLGKPGALNRGIAEARSEILVLVDGDTIFQADTLGRLIAPLAAADVGAVSGNTKVGNRRGFLGGWQHLEYVMGFNLDRRLFDMLGTIPTVPGAIGAFRRSALATVGGLSADTLAEDTDLTMALCRTPWRVVYAPDAIAWTEAPPSLRQLWRQRYRWSYGTMQAMWKHRRAVVERGQSGRFGRYCLTYLALFHVLLPLIAPVVDVFSIYGLMFLDPVKVIGFWLAFVLLQALAGGCALRLDRERLRSLWLLPLQQVVYRQLMYLVTIQSVITALLGTRQRWQVITRVGVFAGRSAREANPVALPRARPCCKPCREAAPTRWPALRGFVVRGRLVAVAHAGLGDQPAGTRRIGFELATQLGHVQPQVAGSVGVSGPPDLGQQLVAAEQLTGVAQQHLEQVPFGRGEPDVLRLRGRAHRAHRACGARARRAAPGRHRRLPRDPLGGQVDDQVAEPDPRQVLGRSSAPDRGAHPGQQFLHAERLGDVVVGPRVERLDLVGAVGSPGQHDDGRLGPAAQALDDLHAVQVGQAQVEDDQVRRVPAGHGERLGPGRRDVHLVLPHPQVDAQRPEDLRLVVDDKYSLPRSLASGGAFRHRLPSSLLRRSSVRAAPRPLWLARSRPRVPCGPDRTHSPAASRPGPISSWSGRRPGCPRR